VRTVVNNIRHNHLARGLNLLLLIALAALPALGQAGETISLYEAMREGKVAAYFTATGSSSGDAIDLTINKTSVAGYGTLTVTVPPGLRLQNANGAWQSMVISGVRGRLGGNRLVPDPVIRLSDAVPSATYLLSVYSAEFHKDNPPPSSQFTVEFPDSTTECILSNASAHGLSVAATQAAEWISTDRVTFNDLQAKLPVSFPDWNAALQVASQCQTSQVQFWPRPVQPAAPAIQNKAPGVNLIVNSIPDSQPASFHLWHITFWTSHSGTLTISPNRIGFEETGAGTHRSDNFEASCSAIKDAARKPHDLNNVLIADATFYIRLRGRSYDFWAGSEDNMFAVLRALSRTCPEIASPGK
jgi:hypothetical protein